MSRPGTGAVMTIAILHFVAGGLGLLYSFCDVISLIGGMNQKDPVNEAMLTQIPGLVPFRIVTVGLDLVLGVVLIVLGIGLLKRGSWARYGSLAYAVVSILLKIFMACYLFLVVNPTAKKIIAEQMKVPVQQQQQMQNIMDFALTFNAVLPLVMMIYPAVVILVMLLPSVAAYFRPDPYWDRDPERDDYRGYDERDYDRRDDYEDRRRAPRIDGSGQIYREEERGGRRGDEEPPRWGDDDR